MRYTVTEEFKTPLHCFAAGSEIDDAEIDGLVAVEGWAALGKIAAVADVAAEPSRSRRAPDPEPVAEPVTEAPAAAVDHPEAESAPQA